MYKSPIEIITEQIRVEQEDGVMRAVLRAGFNVDKPELQRALQYDREQYEKGFQEGKASAMLGINREHRQDLALAMLAGARAIETNRRCDGTTYVRDPFGENDGPLELSYYTAAQTLRAEGERILEMLREG